MMMNNDPYGAEAEYGEQAPMRGWDAPRRTSVWSVLSLISALLICPFVMQFFGILFGIFGIVSVAMSGGKRKGTGLAVAGLVVSIVVMGVYTMLGFAGFKAAEQLGLYPDRLVAALYDNDISKARASFTTAASESLSDADLRELQLWLESNYGKYEGSEIHWSLSQYNKMAQATGRTQYQEVAPIPFLLAFENQTVEAFFEFDPQGSATDPNEIFLIQKITFWAEDGTYREFPASKVVTPVMPSNESAPTFENTAEDENGSEGG